MGPKTNCSSRLYDLPLEDFLKGVGWLFIGSLKSQHFIFVYLIYWGPLKTIVQIDAIYIIFLDD